MTRREERKEKLKLSLSLVNNDKPCHIGGVYFFSLG